MNSWTSIVALIAMLCYYDYAAYQGRLNALYQFSMLQSVEKDWLEQYSKNFNAATNDEERRAILAQHDADAEWFQKQKTIQARWMARPSYYHLGYAPFADYTDLDFCGKCAQNKTTSVE